jgi:hypothetical protein
MRYVLLLTLVAVLLLIWWRMRRQARLATQDRPVDGLDTLSAWSPEATRVLRASECIAYVTLRRALPQHMILAQVPLSRFIRVPTRHSYSEWLRRVGQLCADLVVCDHNSQVVAVVEVQAEPELTNHRSRRRQLRVARVLEAAQIPLYVWIDTALPSAEAARDSILPRLLADEDRSDLPARAGLGQHAQAGLGQPVSTPATDPAPDTVILDAPEWVPHQVNELPEPPPSSWFDDFDSAPAPLKPSKRVSPP